MLASLKAKEIANAKRLQIPVLYSSLYNWYFRDIIDDLLGSIHAWGGKLDPPRVEMHGKMKVAGTSLGFSMSGRGYLDYKWQYLAREF